MANQIYNRGKRDLLNGTFDLLTSTIKVALVTSTYTPNIDTHHYFSDVTNEVSGTNYTAGGQALSNKSITEDDANDLSYFTADNTVWSNSTIAAARGAVIYYDTGTASSSSLIAYIDFVVDKSSSATDFTIVWPSTGILSLS